MTAQISKPQSSRQTASSRRSLSVLSGVAAVLISSVFGLPFEAHAQIAEANTSSSYVPVSYKVNPQSSQPEKQEDTTDLQISADVDGLVISGQGLVTAQGKQQADVTDEAEGATDEDGAAEPTGQTVSPSAKDMPASLTNPVLPNVPTAVKEKQLVTPPKAKEKTNPKVAEPKKTKAKPAPDQPKPNAASKKKAAAKQKTETGPALRRKYSVLFTEQRPFLLYTQDASITYLMPSALVDHPVLSRHLRNILENRALANWQKVRKITKEEALARGDRPYLVITGRVEDRFASKAISSLYLEEMETIGQSKSPKRILTFNFNHDDLAPFGLSDLFKDDGEKSLDPTVALITAYIQADIVRQKTVRLGTQVSLEQDAWLNELKPSLELLQTFTLVPSRQPGKISGLAFHFNPGLLGAEADGSYDVYVPASIFAASLSDRFAPLFAGEALAVSRHNAKGFSAASVNIDGLKSNSELGGDMMLEGEVPHNWCDGFHLTLTDKVSGQIVTEGVVELLPDLPAYGLSRNMLRFRADLSVSGDGGKEGNLMFEPYAVKVSKGRVIPRQGSACQAERSISRPNPNRDVISIPVTY